MVVNKSVVYLYQQNETIMKLELTSKEADLLIDLLSNKAADLNKMLKQLNESWGVYRDCKAELTKTAELHTKLTDLYNKEVK